MMLVSIGGLELRHWSKLARFLWLASRASKQAKASAGCLRVEMFKKDGIYFALSVWDSPADMKRYATSGLHRKIMLRAAETTRAAHNHHYQSDEFPSRDDAYQRWLDSRQ